MYKLKHSGSTTKNGHMTHWVTWPRGNIWPNMKNWKTLI